MGIFLFCKKKRRKKAYNYGLAYAISQGIGNQGTLFIQRGIKSFPLVRWNDRRGKGEGENEKLMRKENESKTKERDESENIKEWVRVRNGWVKKESGVKAKERGDNKDRKRW